MFATAAGTTIGRRLCRNDGQFGIKNKKQILSISFASSGQKSVWSAEHGTSAR
jgi:hypothetical protein